MKQFSGIMTTIVLCILLLPMVAFALPGDLNGSGRVDGFDLILFGKANGSSPTASNWNADADLNGDGTVGAQDLAILSEHFGKNGIAFGLWVGAEYGTEKVFKLSSTGNILKRIAGIGRPTSLSGNIYDGSIWIGDESSDGVKKISGFDGTVQLTVTGMDPVEVSVDPRTGDVWVADLVNNRVIKLLPSITDGYAIGTDTGSHITITGFDRPRSVSVNVDTGVVWVADTNNNRIIRLSPDVTDGYDIATNTGAHTVITGFYAPYDVSVNSSDGTVWVADYNNNAVVKLSATGTTELARIGGFNKPTNLETNPIDGSVWIADSGNNQIVRLGADASRITRVSGFSYPMAVGVNLLDSSVWVADTNNNQIVKLSPNGTELLRVGGIERPISLSVMPDEVSAMRYPTASASLSSTNVDVGETITFDGTGTDPDGSVVLYEWDFDGDGVMDYSSPTPGKKTYAYTTEGLYNPVFRVTDNQWLTATDYSNFVRVGALKAMATADVTTGTAPLRVTFSGSFIDPINGFVDSFQWDFDGDNMFDFFSETSPQNTFTYNKPGTYSAVLKITDGPHAAVDTITIKVTPSSPTATATASPNGGAPPLNVNFTGSGSDPDGTIVLYSWDFNGDGTNDWFSVAGGNASYTYNNEGTYTARLTITDNEGLTGTADVTLIVSTASTPLVAVANADKTLGRSPLKVNFNATGSSTTNIVKYEWNFGECSLFYDSLENGAAKWQADSPWQLVTADSYSKTHSWTDSPGGNYADNADVSLTSSAIDMSGVTTASLSFWHRYETQMYYDYCQVEISTDGGTNWSQIVSFHGSSPNWSEYSRDISGYLPNANVQIRFRLTSNENTNFDGWSLDDIKICSPDKDWKVSTNGTATYTYQNSGKFTATLRVTDGNTNQKTDSVIIDVIPASFPQSTATATPLTGDAPLAVKFTGSASDTDGTIAAYQWNFGEEYVWVADEYADKVVRLNQDGTGEIVRAGGFNAPYSVAIDPTNGTVWAADYSQNAVVKLSADGQTELVRAGGFYSPSSVSIDPNDGSVWVADMNNNQVVKLASNGTELMRLGGFYRPQCVSVNRTDGSVWVADYNNHQVVKLASDGSGLIRVSGFGNPFSLDVNSSNGTIWVTDLATDTVIRLASNIRDGYDIGTDTESHTVIPGFNEPHDVSVNSSDGTVWVADHYTHQAVKIAADGSGVLLRIGGFYYPTGIAVHSRSGDVWVADYYNNQVVKLDSNGKEITRLGGFYYPRDVAVADSGSANYFTSATTGNTSHTYTLPGAYHAVFTATDNDGNSMSKSIDIRVHGAPEVTAGSNVNSGAAPLEVYLTATLKVLSGTFILYEWDFNGDGIYDASSETTPNVRHIYQTAGTYAATLRVTTDIGYSNMDSTSITVTPAPPMASASGDPLIGNAPLTVNLTGTGTDPDGTIAKYQWDFKTDGTMDFTSATTGHTSYVYNTAGTYTATLKVTDNSGLSHTDTITIQVKAAGTPVAILDRVSGAEGFGPLKVDYLIQGMDPNGNITSYKIDFDGDGTFETVTPAAFGDNMEQGANYWTSASPWAQITDFPRSGAYCWTDSPNGSYADNADTALTSVTIDLSSATAPKLIFWHRYNLKYDDYGRVEVSGNDGVSWSQIGYYHNATVNQWQKVEYDLAGYKGNATVKIRFRLTSNASDTSDGWYIDDVWVGDLISHTFTNYGNYTSVLRVTDNEGKTSTASMSIKVKADQNMSYVWVADYSNNRVVKLSEDGDMMAVVKGFNRPRHVKANPNTGEVWVSDQNNDRVIKLAADVPDGYDVSLSYTLDPTANVNNGLVYGNTTAKTGQLASGLYFDGNGDYVQIPDHPSYRMTSWTLEAWIKPDSFGGIRTLVGKVSQGKDYALVSNEDKIGVLVYSGGRKYLTEATPATVGKWVHVASVFNEIDGMLKLYIDGVFINEIAVSPDTSNTDPLRIGSSYCCGEYFTGMIDDVRIWNVARTAAQIAAAKNAALTGNETGLIGYWKLDSIITPHHRVAAGFDDPFGLSVNTADNSVWVADYRRNRVVKLKSDGTELLSVWGFNYPTEVQVNPADGTVWVSDTYNDRIIRLAANVPNGFLANASATTPDASPNAHLSMVSGDVAPDTGKINGSLRFDGDNDYVVIKEHPTLDVQAFTVEAWVKPTSVNSRALFMRGNSTGGNELYFGIYNSKTWEAIVDNGSTVQFGGDIDFTDGLWHHVALTYDTAQLTCYVDGEVYGTPTASTVTLDFGSSQALIGADFDYFNSGLGNYFHGSIDDVRFWNVARSAANLKAAMNSQLIGTEAGLVGYWKMNTRSADFARGIAGFNDPYGLALDSTDNSIWVADFYNNNVVKLAADGTEVHRIGGYNRPYSLSVDPNDRSVWIADHENDRIVKMRSDTVESAWVSGMDNPYHVSVNPEDSTVWIADHYHHQIVKLAADGTELLRMGGFYYPTSVSIDPAQRNQNQPPTVTTSATPDKGNAPLTVTFSGSATDDGSIVSYEWDFDGDGVYDFESATTGNTTHTFDSPGTYSPMFRVTDNSGNTAYNMPGTIYIGPLTVYPTASPATGKAPLKVAFNGTVKGIPAGGRIEKYEWDFTGDGVYDYSNPDAPNTTFNYPIGGDFNAILRVTDDQGDQAYARIHIMVDKQEPTATNSCTPTTGNAPLKVSLNGYGRDNDGSIVLYEWDYDGDGTYDWFSTSVSNTYFTYTQPGTYTATLRVTDNDGLTGTAPITITVGETQIPPTAEAAANVIEGAAPLLVTFTGTGTDPDDQTIQTYEWDFEGDGIFDYTSADTGNTTHTYSTVGIYRAVFRVTDLDGLTASADAIITVKGSKTPTAKANADIQIGDTPLTVNFNAAGSSDPDGTIVSYDWSFGDGIAWVADYNNHRMVKIQGYQSQTILTGFNNPYRVAVDMNDGSIWTSNHSNKEVVKIDGIEGIERFRVGGFNGPYGIAVDQNDGSVWVADHYNNQVVKLDASGAELSRTSGFYNPTSVDVYQADGSVWVSDYNNSHMVRLDSNGNETTRLTGFNHPFWISVDQKNGAVWVADRYNNRIVKLSESTPSGYDTSVERVTPEHRTQNSMPMFGNAVAGTGKLAGGVTLDGNGDYVLIPNQAIPDLDSFTIEAWIKPTYANSLAIFMRGNLAGGNEIYFGLYNTTTLEVIINDETAQRFAGSVNVTDGNWHHAALTFDSATGTMALYLDGNPYDTTRTLTAALEFEGSHSLIGADFDGFNKSLGNYFNGSIDDVRVWNVARTGEQIAGAKDAALTGTEAGLVGYWKLDKVSPTPYHKILTGFNEPVGVEVNPSDGCAWVCDFRNNQMVKIDPDCQRELVRVSGFNRPHEATINPFDSTVWIADHYNNQIAVLDQNGKVLRRISGFNAPTSVGIYPVPGDHVRLTKDEAVTHTYTRTGEYLATLTVTDNNGNTDTDIVSITAGVYPESIPIAYPTSGVVPLSVRFTANGYSPYGTIEYFEYDYDGDGKTDWTTRITSTATYIYTQPGTYRATQTITDNRGLKATKEIIITVLPSTTAPVVSAAAIPAEGEGPLDVTLTGLASDSNGTIVRYQWDFEGDGVWDFTSTTTGITSHTYSQIGVYTAKFRVRDSDGELTVASVRIEVKAVGAPKATASASKTSGPAALEVAFTATATDNNGTIVEYAWDFDGDGTYDYTSNTTGNTNYTYLTSGSFNALLRVKDNSGLTDTDRINILVTAGITASLSRDVIDPSIGERVQINSVLTSPATITVRIKDQIGTVVRTLVNNAARVPGYYSDTWNGKDSSGAIVKSGTYLFVIEYTVGGVKYEYDVTNNVSADRYTPSVVYPPSFDPFNAETNFFRYTLDTKSEVTVYISPFTSGALERIKTLLTRKPQKAGSYVLTWDGTDDSGNVVPAANYVIAVMGWRLPENAIIVNTRPILSDLLVKPNYLNPEAEPYDDENQATFSYTLSKPSDVKASIYDSQNYIVRVITATEVPAGSGHNIIWDGKNSSGNSVAPGIYRVKLIATGTNGEKSDDMNTLLEIFY